MVDGARITLVASPGPLIAVLQDLTLTTLNPVDLPAELDQAARAIAASRGTVVVLGAELGPERAVSLADTLDRSHPEIDILVLGPTTETFLAQAMAAGVRRVIPAETDADGVREQIVRTATTAQVRRERLAPAAAVAAPVATATGEPRGRVVAVTAAKGGVGKTTLAVNLATELARNHQQQVVLVDLDLMAGDVDLLLGLQPTATVASVASEGMVVDAATIKLCLTAHPSGLLVLPGPESLVDADGVDPELAGEVLDVLATSFRFVVVDTAPGAGAALATAAEQADNLLLVATADLGGLRSLRRNLDGLDELGITSAARQVVLNRTGDDGGLDAFTIEESIGLAIANTIPDRPEVAVAANQGQPLVLVRPEHDVSKAIRTIAGQLDGSAEQDNGSRASTRTGTRVEARPGRVAAS